MLWCPLTTQVKGYPFEVRIAGTRPVAALADQVKSLDWMARAASRKSKVSPSELAEIRAKAIASIDGSWLRSNEQASPGPLGPGRPHCPRTTRYPRFSTVSNVRMPSISVFTGIQIHPAAVGFTSSTRTESLAWS